MIAERRADCYRLLSALFHPPERDRLLGDRTCAELADALRELDPGSAAAEAAAELHGALAATDDLDLRIDHAALFVGPFALEAPPYGSVYLEDGRALMGETTLAAAACYAAAGLEVVLHEPADHVAVELEFLHYLATLATQAADRGDGAGAAGLADRQREFLHAHLGAWAPAFCAAMARGASTRFYRVLATCLGAFVVADLQRGGGNGFAVSSCGTWHATQ